MGPTTASISSWRSCSGTKRPSRPWTKRDASKPPGPLRRQATGWPSSPSAASRIRVFFISAQKIAPHPQDVVAFVVHGHKGAFSFRGVGAAHDDSVVSAFRRNISAAEVPPKEQKLHRNRKRSKG